MTSPDLVLIGSYDYGLVALSVLVAIVSSYTALDLAARVTAAHGWARVCWLAGGSTAMGIGIWSMHYTGMLAFRLPVPVQYDWPIVLLSLLMGVLCSALALVVVSRRNMGWIQASAAGIFMGGGVSVMHYTAMAAMRLAAMCRYSPVLVALSVVLAIVFSLIALWLAFLFRGEAAGRMWRKIGSALVMGAAITGMHYTAMAAASFARSTEVPDLTHAVSISILGTVAIALVALMVLGMALLTSLADRLQKQKALLDELFEQAPQALALMNVDSRVVRVNREFTQVFGYAQEETIDRRLSDLIVPEESREEVRKSQELAARGQRVELEGTRLRKDGTRLQVAVSCVPVSLPSGQIAIYAILADITKRKQAEEQLQHSFAQLRALAVRLDSAREEERSRVAREIHDELGQALTAIKIDLSFMIRELPEDQKQTSPRIERIMKLADETIESVRRISTELRPGILDELGLVAALEWAAEEFQGRTGTRCRVSLPDVDIAMDPDRATALFRILQEALTNVARHANATEVTVLLAKDHGDLSLEVRDNGKGIGEEQLSAGQSLGILGMRERALLLGGELTISGAPGKGTTVRVRVPEAPRKYPEQGN